MKQHVQRTVVAGLAISIAFYAFPGASSSASAQTFVDQVTYPIVDTGQYQTFGDVRPITTPQPGEAYFGQDAQTTGHQPSYATQGQTVIDQVTGLTWTSAPDVNNDGEINADDKLPVNGGQSYVEALNNRSFGGYTDWRIPTVKELYSLIDFSGTEPSGPNLDRANLRPFIDTDFFSFSYGDVAGEYTEAERILDAQFMTSTLYADGGRTPKMFGVNFADGRIKGYDLQRPDGGEKTFFILATRGNTDYGINDFQSTGPTVIDQATGLEWDANDSSVGMDWQAALSWVEEKNATHYLGHNDWRLPNIKELHSIVDYGRSPGTTQSPAIDPVFHATAITNEAGQRDYGYYWSSTSHVSADGNAAAATYISLGRALGYMRDQWVDIHGAGAQRSDPKSGSPSDYPTGRGPQGDAIRINNFVRLVRDADVSEPEPTPPTVGSTFVPIAPSRVYDSRFTDGKLPGGSQRIVSVADGHDVFNGAVDSPGIVPMSATSVAYNVTVVDPHASTGWLSIMPGDQSQVTSSTVNWTEQGEIIANAATTALDGNRQVTIHNGSAGSLDVILDVVGYFHAPAGINNESLWHTVTPERAFDSRISEGGSGPLTGNPTNKVTVNLSTYVPEHASAAVVNVTVVHPTQGGYLAVQEGTATKVTSSLVNWKDRGDIVANSSIIPMSPDGQVSLFTSSTTDVIIDVVGAFVPATMDDTGAHYYPVSPFRAYDARFGRVDDSAIVEASPIAGRTSRVIPLENGYRIGTSIVAGTQLIPENAQAVSYNVTAVNQQGPGWLAILPHADAPLGVSTVNWTSPHQTIANGSYSSVTARTLTITNGSRQSSNAIVDITGYFA